MRQNFRPKTFHDSLYAIASFRVPKYLLYTVHCFNETDILSYLQMLHFHVYIHKHVPFLQVIHYNNLVWIIPNLIKNMSQIYVHSKKLAGYQ